ncbi:TetR/AcrR family transcriptional regulator [Gordonia zhaorongruii]|uniref:TetR/AcrR family transcriptional regulator n=1 Tax=Gordonia zhaorongruii TaxID=2597659 RepID=UPI00104B5709|nr:TetR/AcrR family transcriptional regulator [Gordonia zhaorongruii]
MARNEVVRDYGGVSADDRRELRRLKLLAAGRRAWGEDGLGEITVRGVSREAGLAYRYFYEHFANRDALVLAVADQVRDELVATLVRSSTEVGGDIANRLRGALTAFLTTIGDDPQMFHIMTSDVSAIDGMQRRRQDTLDLVAEVILQQLSDLPGNRAGGENTGQRTSFQAVRFVVGGVNRLIEAWLVERDVSPAELADTCTRLSMRVAAD